MARTYTLKRRAEQQAETRRRIVDAAVDLHSSLGPAFTTLSMVAERAGVQRHTLYAHFPDEWSLWLACSGTSLERDPLPDPVPWQAIEDQGERLRTGLRAVYGWYERNSSLAACVLRDAETHEMTRKIVALRIEPRIREYHETLGAGMNRTQRAMLRVALNFFCWRSLVEQGGLKPRTAVETMVKAVDCGQRDD